MNLSKREKYQLSHALLIAMSSKDAKVASFYASYEKLKLAWDYMMAMGLDGLFNLQTKKYTAPSGGTLVLRQIDSTNRHDICGTVISHGFYDECVDYLCQQSIELRIRSTTTFTTYPIGMYSPWGAKVHIDY